MIYGYIRVSTDRQTVENQRFEINNFCQRNNMIINKWIEETVSGTKDVEKRKLNNIMKKMRSGDIIVASELSRLGRTLFMIMHILKLCMDKDVKVWTIKDNYRLGDDISSKVLAFAFGLSAEIERNLISQRTKEALARKKKEGVILGRPKGSKNSVKKLTGLENDIKNLIERGISKSAIARILGVHRLTVAEFIAGKRIEDAVEWDESIRIGTLRKKTQTISKEDRQKNEKRLRAEKNKRQKQIKQLENE